MHAEQPKFKEARNLDEALDMLRGRKPNKNRGQPRRHVAAPGFWHPPAEETTSDD